MIQVYVNVTDGHLQDAVSKVCARSDCNSKIEIVLLVHVEYNAHTLHNIGPKCHHMPAEVFDYVKIKIIMSVS